MNADNPLIEKSIAEAEIPKVTGVSVVGVLGNDERKSFRLKQNDLVAIIGSPVARHRFHCYLNPLSEKCLVPSLDGVKA